MNDLENIIGGHLWLGSIFILGGIWHILTKPFEWDCRTFVSSREAYLSFSLGDLSIFGFILKTYFLVSKKISMRTNSLIMRINHKLIRIKVSMSRIHGDSG